jgi:hypothetical protein
MFKELYHQMALVYGANFLKRPVETRYDILKSNLLVGILNSLYGYWIKDEIEPIENLLKEEKEKYWDIAKGLSDEKEQRIKICKAAYILTVMTN